MTIGRIDCSTSGRDLLSLDQELSVELMGDAGAQIAALLVRSARDSRDLARAAEDADEEALTALEDAQVQELRDQADATRSAAQSRALGQALVAGADLFCVTTGASGDLQVTGAAIKAGAQLGQGALNFAAAESDFEAGVHDANSTQAANRARHLERQLQDLNEEQRDAAQLVRSAIESAAELVRTKNATDQATLFLRG